MESAYLGLSCLPVPSGLTLSIRYTQLKLQAKASKTVYPYPICFYAQAFATHLSTKFCHNGCSVNSVKNFSSVPHGVDQTI